MSDSTAVRGSTALQDRLRAARRRRALEVDDGPMLDPAAPVELSSAQRRLWFLQQLEPHSSAYNVPIVHDLEGSLDADRLAAAWSAVVTRHAVLRVRYDELDGEPVPVLDAEPADRWSVVEGALATVTAAVVAEPFDLSTEQPWRAVLVRDGARSRLVIVVHHVACDGWSIGVLAEDLAAAYRSGEPLPVGPQHHHFAAWRRTPAGLEGGSLEHWTRHLAGAPAMLDLPTDRRRPPIADSRGATVHEPLGADVGAAVRAVTAATGTTPFMVLLAGLHVVLGRWASTDDVVIGTPVAGRTLPAWERVVGCLVTTIALRTRSTESDTVRSLLAHVRETVADGLANQAVGFEEVVDALGVDRDVSSTPIYQVALTVHSEPGVVFDLGDVRATWVDETPALAKVDLGIHVDGDLVALEAGPSTDATAAITYRAGILDEATVRRLVGHLRQVLLGFAASLDAPLASVSMLTVVEAGRLPLGAHRSAPAPEVAGARTLAAMVASVAEAHPDAVAVTSRGVDLDYRGLVAEAAGVAQDLAAAGVRSGDRVALLADRSVELVAAMLGITSLGAAYVPVDPMYPDERIASLVAASGAAAVLVQPHVRARLASDICTVDLHAPGERDGEPTALVDVASPDDVAYVLFTSGTTGTPKGVQVEHRHLLGYLAALPLQAAIEPGWSWALLSTPSADLGLTNLFGALSAGGRIHVLTYQQATDPEQVAGYLRRHRVDAMKLVPSHLAALWDDADPAAVLPGSLLVLAGEAVPWSLVDRIAEARPDLVVHDHYGPSETTVSTMGMQIAGPGAPPRSEGEIAPIGVPFAGTVAHVLDRRGLAVPDGVPGELVLAGPTIARGYLDLPAATAARFTSIEGLRAYRTGDRVRRLATGVVEFLGRLDDQVKIRGYRVEPGEVAAALRTHAAVGDAVVVAREDRPGLTTLAAYVRLVDGVEAPDGADVTAVDATAAVDSIRAFARNALPDAMVPTDIVIVPGIPLTANGKVDRAALPAPDASRRTRADDRAPASDAELRVAAVWRDVLGLDEVGATADFFDLGGDSFSAVRVARAIGAPISVVDVFSAPTVAGLAAVLDGTAGRADESGGLLRRLDRGSIAPAVHVVCVPYGGGSPVTFAPLAARVDATVAVHGVDLPGHDTSRRDDPLRPIGEVADALVDEIAVLEGDVVLYGHCLGGALAVETALRLEQSGRPVAGVVTGGTFPAARLPGRLAEWWHRVVPSDRWLSNRAYHEMLRSLGGFTDVVDEDDRDFLVRALRHDARSAEAYYTERYAAIERGEAQSRLEAPMLCVVGDRDRSTELFEERFAEWRDFSDDVDLAVIPEAGHYFLKHQADDLARILLGRVAAWRAGRRPTAASPVDEAPAASTKTFLWVAITQLLSMIGTGLTAFGVGIWVLQETGSVTLFSLISVLALLPAIALMPVAGAIADRFDRRIVMLLADGAAGLSTTVLLTLYLTSTLELWYVFVFTTIGATANAFQRPAYLAAITQLVPKRYLGQAAGLVGLGTNAGDLIAALIGGIVVGAFGLHAAIAIDLVVFVLAWTVLLVVRFPARLWVRLEETFRQEIAGGWRYIAMRRPLVVMVVFFVVFNLLFAIPNLLATPLVLADHSPEVLGMVLAGGGLGAMLGTAAMAIWGGTRRRAIGMVAGTISLGVGFVVLGLTSLPIVMGLGMLIVFASLMLLNAHWLALIQSKVGLDLQGRVLAINQMLAMSAMPIGLLVAGPLTGVVGEVAAAPVAALATVLPLGEGAPISVVVVVLGVAMIAWGVLGLSTRALRRMEDDLPDAMPDGVILRDKDALQAQADAAYAQHADVRA